WLTVERGAQCTPGALPGRAQVHQAVAHRDLAHPGAERRLAPVVTEVVEQADHAVLEHILGGGPAAHQAPDQREYRPGGAFIDVSLRIAVAGRRKAKLPRLGCDGEEAAHTG